MSKRNYLFGLIKDKEKEEKMLMQKYLQEFVLKEKRDKEEKLKSTKIGSSHQLIYFV